MNRLVITQIQFTDITMRVIQDKDGRSGKNTIQFTGIAVDCK
jgi:hypothetical protein